MLGLEIKSEETELHQERQKATRKWKCRNIDSKRKKEPFAFCDGVKIGFDWFYLISRLNINVIQYFQFSILFSSVSIHSLTSIKNLWIFMVQFHKYIFLKNSETFCYFVPFLNSCFCVPFLYIKENHSYNKLEQNSHFLDFTSNINCERQEI